MINGTPPLDVEWQLSALGGKRRQSLADDIVVERHFQQEHQRMSYRKSLGRHKKEESVFFSKIFFKIVMSTILK